MLEGVRVDLAQISNLAEAGLCFGCLSSSEDGVPHRGRGIGLNLQFADVELDFANAAEKFDA